LVPDGERSNFNGLRESWEISASIRSESGRTLASVNPYFQVLHPSRYYDPDLPDGVGRVVDLCFELAGTNEMARGELCDETTGNGSLTGLGYDDPRSAFTGAQRFVDINSNRIRNADGPTVWYSDPFGRNASAEPFPGAVAQYIAKTNNDRAIDPSGPAIGRDRDYGSTGVHAPN
jgi:hypothetical protein